MEEKKLILIAEDDEASRLFLKRILEMAGYEVRTADDGVMALELFEKEDIRLVLTDWMMPRMGGLELCRAIRERAREGYVFVIMVTARDCKSDIVEAMDAGADDYVTKPYDKEELMARIRAGARIISLEKELSDKNRDLFKANSIMKNDLVAARRLQKSFLPGRPPEVPGVRFSWFFKPCQMVGGDTFNCFSVNDDYAAVYVLDVSGHGVPAAMLSVMLSRILTPDVEGGGILCLSSGRGCGKKLLLPQEAAQILNRRFPMDEDVGQYFTLLYVTVHVPSLTMNMVQAGHPHMAILGRNGDVEFIRRVGCPIGMFDDTVYQGETLSLSRGDRIFLFTDGIIEAWNHQGESYGLERFSKALKANGAEEISTITDGILEDVMGFVGKADIQDDMTLIGFSLSG